jgi:hypothetical protein
MFGRQPLRKGDRPNSQCMAERQEKVKLRFKPPWVVVASDFD